MYEVDVKHVSAVVILSSVQTVGHMYWFNSPSHHKIKKTMNFQGFFQFQFLYCLGHTSFWTYMNINKHN